MVINRPEAVAAETSVWSQQVQVDSPRAEIGQTSPEKILAGEAMRVLDLGKTFRSGFLRKKIRGISGVSFSVAKGEVFALLGHNGAGKTTTINCILDLIHPDTGEVTILGKPAREIRSRSRIGYLPERPYFFEHLTGRELLDFYAKLLAVEEGMRKNQVEMLLEKTGMTSAADRPLRKYSKGMLQRIGLAQALLGDPDLLIMDEPMSGLDPLGRREVRQILQELKARGKTIILSSHIVPDVEILADTVGIMCEGELVKTCDLSRLANQNSYEIRIQDPDSPLGQTSMKAADVGALEVCLDQCRTSGKTVLAVETIRTALEDLYLSVNAQRKES